MLKDEEAFREVAQSLRFDGAVEGGYCWDQMTRARVREPKALEAYGYKVYSQNDEDGIIHEIFRRIGVTNKTFVEFGVQNGLESNCHLLLFYGWRGLWIEGAAAYCDEIRMRFRPVIESEQLHLIQSMVTRENINSLLRQGQIVGEIDLLSVDIDGNDYHIWKAIDCIRPRVVITEYNGKFPPDLEWKQAYDGGHIWTGSDWHGASLKAFELLGREKGYSLVGTNLRGCNAFFVRDDLVGNRFLEPYTAEALYNPLRLRMEFIANHPAQFCLVRQQENLGMKNYIPDFGENG